MHDVVDDSLIHMTAAPTTTTVVFATHESHSSTSPTGTVAPSHSSQKMQLSSSKIVIIVSCIAFTFLCCLALARCQYERRRRRYSDDRRFKIAPFEPPERISQISSQAQPSTLPYPRPADARDRSLTCIHARDAASTLRRLEEISFGAEKLKVQDKGQTTFSPIRSGAPSGSSTTATGSAEHMQAGIASLRVVVEQMKRHQSALAASSSGRTGRPTPIATGKRAKASDPSSFEMLHELSILRAEIEELFLQHLPPGYVGLDSEPLGVRPQIVGGAARSERRFTRDLSVTLYSATIREP